jgi:hypothetical protein
MSYSAASTLPAPRRSTREPRPPLRSVRVEVHHLVRGRTRAPSSRRSASAPTSAGRRTQGGHADQAGHHQAEVARHRARLDKLTSYVDQAYTDRLEERITPELWERRSAERESERRDIEWKLAGLQTAKTNYLASGIKLLKLAQRAHELYVSQSPHEQRRLLNVVVSNCTLRDGTVRYRNLRIAKLAGWSGRLSNSLPRAHLGGHRGVRSGGEVGGVGAHRSESTTSELVGRRRGLPIAEL